MGQFRTNFFGLIADQLQELARRKRLLRSAYWLVKGVGGSSQHWAGASLRFQEHEWKALTTYGNVTGASLLDWPIDAKTMDPYYTKAEDKLRVTRTGDRKGLPGNNNFKVFEAGAKKLGYKDVHTDVWRLTHGTMTTLLRQQTGLFSRLQVGC